ncbi:DUF5615 family PIN-like protein [Thermosynechococcaceae cyanobacterium BACA0444]|uniref:DUF5615 family PIN-like protein n=1 Tax=Pseudocalidococcus azoricus BACA0444 TaxID=2918990 RepID=A0AAE4FT31_9CYAN|nr:DUF5615 family PIN-like protein [Pseudocalidococcus azoricus]MDS3860807.1 DUF5615 family PIN-like protein [Pseudocalidococcus azoricus BACA0444]
MKFLVYNCISWIVRDQLCGHGYDAVHVRYYGLQEAEDIDIFRLASQERRIIISADTDFGTLLADTRAVSPSVILFRGHTERKPAAIAQKLLDIFNDVSIQEALKTGAIIIIMNSKIRIKSLPIKVIRPN